MILKKSLLFLILFFPNVNSLLAAIYETRIVRVKEEGHAPDKMTGHWLERARDPLNRSWQDLIINQTLDKKSIRIQAGGKLKDGGSVNSLIRKLRTELHDKVQDMFVYELKDSGEIPIAVTMSIYLDPYGNYKFNEEQIKHFLENNKFNTEIGTNSNLGPIKVKFGERALSLRVIAGDIDFGPKLHELARVLDLLRIYGGWIHTGQEGENNQNILIVFRAQAVEPKDQAD